jgi:hypothetical protein
VRSETGAKAGRALYVRDGADGFRTCLSRQLCLVKQMTTGDKRHPVALYSDKHGIFRVNSKDAAGGNEVTQFGRALLALNILISTLRAG